MKIFQPIFDYTGIFMLKMVSEWDIENDSLVLAAFTYKELWWLISLFSLYCTEMNEILLLVKRCTPIALKYSQSALYSFIEFCSYDENKFKNTMLIFKIKDQILRRRKFYNASSKIIKPE